MLNYLNENITNSKQDLWLPRLEERGGGKREMRKGWSRGRQGEHKGIVSLQQRLAASGS